MKNPYLYRLIVGISLLLSLQSVRAQCTLDIEVVGELCTSSALTFIPSDQTAFQYTWSFDSTFNGFFDRSPTATWVFRPNDNPLTDTIYLRIITRDNDTCTTSKVINLEASGSVDVNRYEGEGLTDEITSFLHRKCADVGDEEREYTTTYEVENGPGGPYIFDWGDGSPEVISQDGIETHTYSELGNYFLTIRKEGLACPVYTEEIIFQFVPVAGLKISGDPIVCENDEICIQNLTDIENSPVDYFLLLWGDGTPAQTFADTFSRCHTYGFTVDDVANIGFAGLNSEVTLIANNSCGSHTTRSQINVRVQARASFDFTNPGCENDPEVCFTNTTVPSPSYIDPPSFAWNFGDPNSGDDNISRELNPCHEFSGPGTYIVTLAAENGCGNAAAIDTVVILENPIAQTNVIDTAGCAPYEIEIRNTSVPASTADFPVSALWSVSPNSGATILDANDTRVNLRFEELGIYTVRLAISSDCGQDTWEQEFVIGQTPDITLEAIADTCNSFEYEVSPSMVSYNDYGLPITDYTWEFTGGTPSTSSGAIPTGTVAFSQGTHTVRVNATNLCGTRSVSQEFTVAAPSKPDAGADTALCLSDAPLSFTGLPDNGIWTGNFIQNDGVFRPLSPDTYELIYTTGGGQCLRTDTLEVLVRDTIPLSVIPDIALCEEPTPIKLTASPVGGSWSGPGLLSDTTVIPDTPGDYAYVYAYADPQTGCSSTGVFNLEVNALPQVALRDTLYCLGNDSFTLTDRILQAEGSCRWTGPGIINAQSGTFLPDTAGTYRLVLSCENADNCVDSSAVIIEVIAPEPAVAGRDSSICRSAGTYTFTEFSPMGGEWIGSGVIAGTNQVDLNQANGGLYIYEFGAGSCLSRDTVTLTILESDNLQVPEDQILCEGSGPFPLTAVNPTNGIWSGLGVDPDDNSQFLPELILPGTSSELTYTVINQDGCNSAASLSIFVDSLPTAQFVLPDTSCQGVPISFQQTSIYASSYQWEYGNGEGSVSSEPTYTYPDTGSYTVRLQVTNANGCADETAQEMVVTEAPSAFFTPDLNEGCSPLSVTFTDGSQSRGSTYLWDFGNGVSSSSSIPPTTTFLQGPTDTTYTVTLTLQNTCGEVSYTDGITVFPQPQVNFGFDKNRDCSPLELSFSNVSLGDPDTYSWDMGNGNTSSRENPFPQIYTADTLEQTYTITLTGFNECGSDTLSKTLTVLPNTIRPIFLPDTNRGCAPLSIQLAEFSGAPFTSWDLGDGTLTEEDEPLHTYAEAGVYEIQFFANNGCSYDTSSTSITVYPAPDPTFMASEPVCEGESMPFSPTQTTDISSYQWDFGDGQTASQPEPSYLFGQAGTYRVTLTVISDTFQCSANWDTTVTVRPTPPTRFSVADTQGCQPFSLAISNVISGLEYSWDFGDGNSSAQQVPDFTYLSAGSYELSLTTLDIFGCEKDTTVEVTVYPKPQSNFSLLSDSLCAPQTASFLNASTDAIDFLWDFDNGLTNTLTNPQTVYQQAGLYQISLISGNEFGCTDTSAQSLQVFPQAVASFEALPAEGCVPLSVQFQNTSTGYDQLNWSFGDFTSSDDISPAHLYELVGNYTVELIVDTAGVCGDTLRINDLIQVNPNPVSTFLVDSDSLCAPAELDFTNASQGAVRYRWNFGNGQESALSEPTASYTQEGTYLIRLISLTEFGCADTSSYEATVYPQATALFSVTPEGGCSPLDVTFSNLSSGYNRSQWIVANTQMSVDTSPQFSIRDSGSYDVQLVVNTDGFCGDTLSIQGQLNVRPSPIPSFTYTDASPDPVSRGTVLFTNTSQLADSYLWDFGDGKTSTAPNPVHTYTYNGPFAVTLIAFKNNGCTADTTILVNPVPFYDLKIPNAFAPVDVPFDSTQYRQTYALKGSAAVFHPRGVGLQNDGYEIAIYNKWGKRVWYSNKVDDEGRPAEWWDGRIGGKLANIDTFVWKVHKAVFLGGAEWGGPREGTVTLIR